ncbi:chemotaxis protein CheA [Erythrobacter sp. QSSC1-22B]|uniref:chemotaxis protein CheA n=1 Tax=Erythrobacter sp. QSSC1-22B TaxID=1860125 RepID=UPI000805848A|nr:chemotaxis protein CheW [Erythrobacter sp. QSSC1-22B]OBX18873.1 chemotaxis protein CheA [Erythrobacter sp. QSSC1-22B]
MDDLLADFVAETREMLEASGEEIVAWEADPSDKARLDTIFRFVHTVKGNCGFFDFPRLERLSHAAEDALADCRAGRREPDRALVSAVLAIMDRIGQMNDAIEAGEDYPAGGDDVLIAALQPGLGGDDPAEAPIADATSTEEGTHRSSRTTTVQRSIRLPVDLLDEVMKGVSDMVLARNDLARRLREAGEQPTLDGPFERLSAILADVRNATTRMRMQRLEHLFGSLPRLVRDLSNELGKQVSVEFEGGDVELDREMVEMVRDPLTHIIRNAIDHGIEPPDQRRVADKGETGQLKFTARQSGNRISLAISDDGRGIDIARLESKAIAAGIYTRAEVARMDERQKRLLIFEPGLSTAEAVSSVSGRGVGMDVVRANIEKVGGSIDVFSQQGEGTTFYLQLPLTLSIMPALTVESQGRLYALPRSYIQEIVFAKSRDVELAQVGERQLLTFRDRRVPCIALRHVLAGDEAEPVDWLDTTLVLIRLATDEVFALAVDRVHDHEDVVVKPIPPAILETGIYAGTTLLDDGRPMMLLDVPNIARDCGLLEDLRAMRETVEDVASVVADKPSVPVMLFTGLDQRRRAVRLDLVQRIDTVDRNAIDIEGGRAQVVIDDRLFALVGHNDGPLPERCCRLLRLSDGESEIALIVADVLDAAEIDEDMHAQGKDPRYAGIALLEGRPVPVVDVHRLFAEHGSPVASESPGASENAATLKVSGL